MAKSKKAKDAAKELFKLNKSQAVEAKKSNAAYLKSRKPAGKLVDLTAKTSLTAKYGLPYSANQSFKIDEKKAAELLENDDAKLTETAQKPKPKPE